MTSDILVRAAFVVACLLLASLYAIAFTFEDKR